MISHSRVLQSTQLPTCQASISLFILLFGLMSLLSGCANFSTRGDEGIAGNRQTDQMDSVATREMSYAEYVFRRQNEVVNRSMFLVDTQTQLSDASIMQIESREESLFEACQAINEVARLRSQQEEEGWLQKIKVLFTLDQCAAAADDLDVYLLNLESEAMPTALGAL